MPGAGAASPAMVGGDNNGGVVFIKGIGLYIIPQVADDLVHLGGLLQVEIITAAVSEIVGLAQAEEYHAGFVLLYVFARAEPGEHIVARFSFYHHAFLHAVDKVRRRIVALVEHFI